MNNVTNFYDELDLKYPEIAIAMQNIDRINPGYVKCIIPILTPNLSTTSLTETTVRQSTTNLMNSDNIPQVNNIKMTNYVKLKIPKELCGFVGGAFNMLERVDYSSPDSLWPRVETKSDKLSKIKLREAITNIENAHQVGSGSVLGAGKDCGGGNSINVNGKVSGIMKYKDGIPSGLLHLMPVDRYIFAPSKWIVVFIGGDVTKPRIIGRYFDDDEN